MIGEFRASLRRGPLLSGHQRGNPERCRRVMSISAMRGIGGVEVALGQRMSVFAEGGVIGIFGQGCCEIGVRAGLNFHLGN